MAVLVPCGLLLFATAPAAQIPPVQSELSYRFPVLDNGDEFGSAVTPVGDLDGDGNIELAVGAKRDDAIGQDEGAVWILFMRADGTVRTQAKIGSTAGKFTGDLDPLDAFGASLAALGDLNGDGIEDLAVGAPGDDDGGTSQGAVWILFMGAAGQVKITRKISTTVAGLGPGDLFGTALASPGDLDRDGVADLCVSALGDDDAAAAPGRGAVWVLFLNPNGTVKGQQKILHTTVILSVTGRGGLRGTSTAALGPGGDGFGMALASVGDLDADGVPELAVGGALAKGHGGAFWIEFLRSNGTVRKEVEISRRAGFGGQLRRDDFFGTALATLGDLDGDGVPDLAVGDWHDSANGERTGAVWILLLDASGGVKAQQKFNEIDGGFGGDLRPFGAFGRSLAAPGDLDGDGARDLVVGAPGYTNGGIIWFLYF